MRPSLKSLLDAQWRLPLKPVILGQPTPANPVKEVGSGAAFGCVSAGGPCRASGRLRASATKFSCQGMCLMSDINSALKDKCRCLRANQGGSMVRNRAVTSGL